MAQWQVQTLAHLELHPWLQPGGHASRHAYGTMQRSPVKWSPNPHSCSGGSVVLIWQVLDEAAGGSTATTI